MGITKYNIQKLQEVRKLIEEIPDGLYQEKAEIISDSTIGQHFRHIIEFYQSVMNLQGDTICYDDRVRNVRLETERGFVSEKITEIINGLNGLKSNKEMTLRANYGEKINEIIYLSTSIHRELAYALDHCIHHLAIIKIAISQSSWKVNLDPNLGVAPSTIRYKKNVHSKLHTTK